MNSILLSVVRPLFISPITITNAMAIELRVDAEETETTAFGGRLSG